MFRRALSISICLVFTATNVLFAHSRTNSIWEERRNAAKKQFAALPKHLPLPIFPARPLSHRPQIHPASLIPLAHGTIREQYQVPLSKIGSLSQLIVIQDVHLNQEAQNNISKILTELIGSKKADFIAVEGAFEEFDFSPFRDFPDKKITQDVADAFLKDNRIGAPSYVGVTSENPPPLFMGVDNAEHYFANLAAYKTAEKVQKQILERLKAEKKDLSLEKAWTFQPRLKVFDRAVTANNDGTLSLGDFIKVLVSNSNPPYDANLEKFISAYNLESSIDFNKVQHERTRIMEKLARKLTDEELKTLARLGLAFQMGHINYAEFYRKIRQLLTQNKISLKYFPDFDKYIQYVLLSDEIRAEPLLTAVREIAKEVYDYLAQNEEERRLIAQSRILHLTEKLVKFSLTPAEWEEYKQITSYELRVTKRNSSFIIRNFESFYEEADIRSDFMVSNIIKLAKNFKEKKKPTGVLITGGFHTPGITTRLKEMNVPYVLVSPKITKVDTKDGSSYLSIFSREKSPLEKLFQGEKLFMIPYGQMVGTKHGPNTLFQSAQQAMQKLLKGMRNRVSVTVGDLQQSYSTSRNWAWGFFKAGEPMEIGGLQLQPLISIFTLLKRIFMNLLLTLREFFERHPVLSNTTGLLLLLGLGIMERFWGGHGEGTIALGTAVAVVFPTPPKKTWLERKIPSLVGKNIIEASLEMGLTPEMFKEIDSWKEQDISHEEIKRRLAMAQSVGGIGPLLPERIIAQAELGAKVTGFVPLYEHVYFQDKSNGFFNQNLVPSGKYLRKLLGEAVDEIQLQMYDESVVNIKIFKMNYKNAEVYFLDAPDIFNVAYPGHADVRQQNETKDILRFRQEWVLGRGLLKYLKHIDRKPDFIIQSEAHTLFTHPHLATDDHDPFFDGAMVIFNDHTPLEYAHPIRSVEQLRDLKIDPVFYMSQPVWVDTDVPEGEPVIYVGTLPNPNFTRYQVDLTKLLILAARGTYGVSKEHGSVMRRMASLRDAAGLIDHVTNGVSQEIWQAEDFRTVNYKQISDDDLLRLKEKKRIQLLEYIQNREGENLDPNWLDQVKDLAVVMFDRRIVGYKRFDLIMEILTNRPEEFLASDTLLLLGGRVHQDDPWSQTMAELITHILYSPIDRLTDISHITNIHEVDQNPGLSVSQIQFALEYLKENKEILTKLRERVVFFENYNLWESPTIAQGVDATLMLADKGQEAAATGFMKVQMNGGIVIAVPNEGAVPESVKFLRYGRYNRARESKHKTSYISAVGNGIVVDSNGKDWNSKGKRSGPKAEGVLNALSILGNIRKGKGPDGSEDPQIHPTMIRNAFRNTSTVSVKKTATHSLRDILFDINERHLNDGKNYEMGFQNGKRLGKSISEVQKELAGLFWQKPFVWNYAHLGAEPRPLNHQLSRSNHPQFSIRDFIKSFREVERMGWVGRWSLLYHAPIRDKADSFGSRVDYFKALNEILVQRPRIQENEGLLKDLDAMEKNMQLAVESLTGRIPIVEDIAKELDRAEKATLYRDPTDTDPNIESLRSRLLAAERSKIEKQELVINQIYHFFGFLDGLTTLSEVSTEAPASAPRGALGFWKTKNFPLIGAFEGFPTGLVSLGVLALLLVWGLMPQGPPQELWSLAFLSSIKIPAAITAAVISPILVALHKRFGVLQSVGPPKKDWPSVFKASFTASSSFLGVPFLAYGLLLPDWESTLFWGVVGTIIASLSHAIANSLIPAPSFNQLRNNLLNALFDEKYLHTLLNNPEERAKFSDVVSDRDLHSFEIYSDDPPPYDDWLKDVRQLRKAIPEKRTTSQDILSQLDDIGSFGTAGPVASKDLLERLLKDSALPDWQLEIVVMQDRSNFFTAAHWIDEKWMVPIQEKYDPRHKSLKALFKKFDPDVQEERQPTEEERKKHLMLHAAKLQLMVWMVEQYMEALLEARVNESHQIPLGKKDLLEYKGADPSGNVDHVLLNGMPNIGAFLEQSKAAISQVQEQMKIWKEDFNFSSMVDAVGSYLDTHFKDGTSTTRAAFEGALGSWENTRFKDHSFLIGAFEGFPTGLVSWGVLALLLVWGLMPDGPPQELWSLAFLSSIKIPAAITAAVISPILVALHKTSLFHCY